MAMLEQRGFIDKMNALSRRLDEVAALLTDHEVIGQRAKFMALSKEHADLGPVVEAWRRYLKLQSDIEQARGIIETESDAELREMAREEIAPLEAAKTDLAHEIQILLLPKDPNDSKNTILEIRGGTGGDEAAIFAGDLFRMYSRFAERNGWKIEMMSASEGASGGYKEIVMFIEGKDVFAKLKFESGVHRVQRVPATETQGRIHTSAATVAVLPEAEEVDIKIEDKDLRIDVYRSSGAGGQSVNTTDSAVRITHIPTGIQVAMQDERSQHKNKLKGMKVLRSRLFDAQLAARQAEESSMRKSQVGSGDRSEKIRTYNFPQDRCTDHRIGLTKHNLPSIMDGHIGDIIDALRAHDQAEALKAQADG